MNVRLAHFVLANIQTQLNGGCRNENACENVSFGKISD